MYLNLLVNHMHSYNLNIKQELARTPGIRLSN